MRKKLILSLFLFSVYMIAPVGTNFVSAEQTDKSVYDIISEQSEKKETEKGNEVKEENKATDENKSTNKSLSITFIDVFKLIIALAFVIFLIYFLLKFVTKRNRFFQQAKYVENIGGTSLGTNKSIQLVRLGDKVLILGVGESITLIKEIDNEEESKRIIEEYESKFEQMTEPKDLLQKLSNKLVKRNMPIPEQREKKSFSSTFKEQLTQIKNERSAEIEDVKGKGKRSDE
ncbi:flagellar biosynthetic protein FliO [Metabacillus fastidiosus]|uniref:flagellar biosynthetic protein FliO n=1 Tax=Metabacillus fastidiosus TaxID=1458 RepID=UPI002E242637|nr:flagellar biosynthetic protein FliO [Metabacillus fastidiosus]MED4532504.1 flagellar biosynthetic protein FliO [Metabacillus fastidiosus]